MSEGFPDGDDDLHPDVSDDTWLTETAWYSFWTPGGEAIVHVYLRFRHNLGVADCSVYAWTPGQSLPWDAAYWKQTSGTLPATLTSFTSANGLRHDQLEPYRTYRLRYEDLAVHGPPVRLDVTFRAIGPPEWFGRRHFDQPGRVVGELELDGSVMAVDCLAMRDRSWYHRSDFGLFRSAYSYALTPTQRFLIILAAPKDDRLRDDLPLAGGWWNPPTGDRAVQLVRGSRRVLARDEATGAPLELELEAATADRDLLTARGTVGNSMAVAANTSMFSWMSLVRWRIGGADEDILGEDQEIWSPSIWRAARGRGALRPGETTG